MVIVSSTKSLQNSRKKSSARTASANVTAKSCDNRHAGGKTFSRPAPRPIAISTTSVTTARGKVKTTRNNTLPLPSPKSGLINANGPRIHAQRKFAQGATATFSSSGLSFVQTSFSPAITPTKDSSKIKKRVITPISPPLKRPRTEDFLTFLCFRGTPALPPELEYFSYAQPMEIEDVLPQVKKPKEQVSTAVGCTNTENTQSSVATVASTNASQSNTTSGPARPVTTKSTEAGPQTNSHRNNVSSAEVSRKEAVSSMKKVTKKIIAPQISPSASRINEQEAKFAMTALKLKYQEQRLANARPAKSLITMLTKKVKERSMILTRSRAKTAVGPLKTSPVKRKISKPVARPPVRPISRNAPSPDIILGVAQSAIKVVDSSRRSPSSAESEESSSESKKSSSSESSSSSSESEEEEPVARSLRSGKEVITKPKEKPKSQATAVKKTAPSPRMGTRATHRHTKSPLRELPMWNVTVKKKKILAKYKNNAKAKAKNANPAHTANRSLITRASLRKSTGSNKLSRGRPSRNCKETATINLGLLTKGFSSDDERSSEASDQDEKGSSAGDTSSSETKFLEKQYNASLKRSTKGDSSSSQSKPTKKVVKKQTSSKPSKSSKSSDKSEKKSQDATNKKDKPMPRVLRSQSTGSVDSNKTDSSLAAKRRLLMMTCGKNTAGAARKSAKIVSRGRSRNYSSSEESSRDSSSEMDDADEDMNTESASDASDTEIKPASVKRSATESPMSIPSSRGSRARCQRITDLIEETRSSRSPSVRSSMSRSPVDQKPAVDKTRSDEEENDTNDSEDEVASPASTHTGDLKDEPLYAGNEEISTEENQQVSDSLSSTGTSSSEAESEEEEEHETPEPPQKTSIAIQVDMDLEEEEEERKRKEKSAEQPPSPVELPLSDEQQEELQQAQEEDDEIQEIGQVINNPNTMKNNIPSRSSPPPASTLFSEHQPQGPCINPQPETIIPPPMHHPIPPMSTRTSSLTYTSHHINLGGPSVPFVPYSRPSDFYPPLHFGPTHLVNSVHLVGSATGTGMEFGGDLTSPLSTLSIPVTLPTLPSFQNPLLPPPPPLCLGAGATMTSTSLQTHIRTVATNLDIPLVRPVVGSDTTLPFSLGLGHPPQLGSIPLVGAPPPPHPSMSNLLSRPLAPWSQPAADPRSHYSAFRLPMMQPTSTASSSSSGIKEVLRTPPSSTALPVSIVHPRTLPHQYHQHHQSVGQQLPMSTSLHHQSLSTTHTHVVHNMRDMLHSSSNSSTKPPGYAMHNYNPESIIRNLPNVSIVPKFDRSSAKTQLPSQQPTASTSSNIKSEEPKKPGKKKKPSATLPTPSSPLTVRKDSTNPVTYSGSTSKSKKKEMKEEPAPVCKSKKGDKSSSEDSSKFDILLEKQQTFIAAKTETPHSASEQHPNLGKQDKHNPAIRRVLNSEVKQEVHSASERKSASPSVHRKTPERPGSSGSANSSKSHSSDSKRNGGSSSNKLENKLREAPTYYLTEAEFEDPLKYFEKIQPEAEKFGMARIVPPRSFRPDCNVNDDMRFTAYNHYIHKMFKRWGPTVKETEAIKTHLKSSDVDLSTNPVIGGIEIDFSTLYQAVQSFGGLTEVIEKAKWAEVADRMHIPKGTHDRATKLDAVYVKYILPYDMLSEGERNHLKSQVQEKWKRRQQKLQERTDESSEDETSDEDSMDELDDCVVKGKGTPLGAYFRVARNTVGMIFPNGKEPPIDELEDEYWKIVREAKKHLCVYSGSIDCTGVGWGFPAPKASTKHPWNLKVLANNSGSVLRSMGPVMGATVPTLHVSMLFTSYCWYRDPHGLAWVEYLHSGASKIWYSVPASHEQVFRKALMKLTPLQCKNKKVWLPSDSTMIPPELLLENDVPLVRAVQNPGEFLVVFPKSYTSAICGGYLVSESVCFAPPPWLKSCMETFKDIRDSKEPPVFPIEKLVLSIARDNRVSTSVFKMAAPLAEKVIVEELALRKKIIAMGVSLGGKPSKQSSAKGVIKKKRPPSEEEVEQCYFCNYILHLSLVRNERTDFVTCLPHAIQHLSRHKAQIKKCTLLCEETQEELETLLQSTKRRVNS